MLLYYKYHDINRYDTFLRKDSRENGRMQENEWKRVNERNWENLLHSIKLEKSFCGI